MGDFMLTSVLYFLIFLIMVAAAGFGSKLACGGTEFIKPLVVLIILVIVSSSLFAFGYLHQTTDTIQLHNIATDESVSGNFVFGYGSVQEDTYFVAYRVNEDSSMEYYKMPESKTHLYLTLPEDEQPYAEVTENHFGIVEIKLYLPKDCIRQKIDLDLGK